MEHDRIRKLQDANLELSKQIIAMAGEIARLRASVNVLKLLAAWNESPRDPVAALGVLRDAEELALKNDQNEQERQHIAEMLPFFEKWRKHGTSPGDS